MGIVQQGIRFDKETHCHVVTSRIELVHQHHVNGELWLLHRADILDDCKKQIGRAMIQKVLGDDYENTIGWLRYHLTYSAKDESPECKEALDRLTKLMNNIESFMEQVSE